MNLRRVNRLVLGTIIAAGLVLAALLVGFLGRTPVRPKEAGSPSARKAVDDRPAIVHLETAVKGHPRYGELALLTQEIGKEQDLAKSFAASVGQVSADGKSVASQVARAASEQAVAVNAERDREAQRLQQIYQARLSDQEKEIWAAVQAKIEARKAVLAAQLDEEVGVRRGELKKNLSGEEKKLQEENQTEIISYQLQLGVLKGQSGADEQVKAIQAKLTAKQNEMSSLIAAQEKKISTQLAAYSKERSATAEATLKQYSDDLSSAAEKQLAAVRDQMEKELQTALAAGSKSAAASERQPGINATSVGSSVRSDVSSLRAEREDLEGAIVAQIKEAAEVAAKRRGLRRVVVGYRVNTPGVDITSDVLNLLKAGA